MAKIAGSIPAEPISNQHKAGLSQQRTTCPASPSSFAPVQFRPSPPPHQPIQTGRANLPQGHIFFAISDSFFSWASWINLSGATTSTRTIRWCVAHGAEVPRWSSVSITAIHAKVVTWVSDLIQKVRRSELELIGVDGCFTSCCSCFFPSGCGVS